MADDLSGRLRNAKEDLAAWYERLNAQWSDAEKTLQTMDLPADVWTFFKFETTTCDIPGYDRHWEHMLGFIKHNGEWRICYMVGEVGDPDSRGLPKPILDCSLNERKLALPGIKGLFLAIVEAAEAKASELETALGEAAEVLAQFKKKQADQKP